MARRGRFVSLPFFSCTRAAGQRRRPARRTDRSNSRPHRGLMKRRINGFAMLAVSPRESPQDKRKTKNSFTFALILATTPYTRGRLSYFSRADTFSHSRCAAQVRPSLFRKARNLLDNRLIRFK